MAISITYRGDDVGRWGSGKGWPLVASEIDINFWNLVQAIQDLIDNPVEAVNIASVTVAGTTMTLVMSDASTIGPISLPILRFHWLGPFQGDYDYRVLDTFAVDGVGIFTVQIDHTSGAEFDPAIQVDGSDALLPLFGFNTTIITAGLSDGDILRYDAEAGVFQNVRQKYVVGTNFLGIMGDDQDLLYHRLAADITVPANFGDFLEYSSGAGAIANATAETVVSVQVCPAAGDPTDDGDYVEIGTITIVAGTVAATFETTSGDDQAAFKGDLLRLRGPAIADATLAGFFCTLVAYES